MIQDVKLPLLCRVLPAWSWLDFLLLLFARLSQLLEESSELLLGQLRHALEESQLIVGPRAAALQISKGERRADSVPAPPPPFVAAVPTAVHKGASASPYSPRPWRSTCIVGSPDSSHTRRSSDHLPDVAGPSQPPDWVPRRFFRP